MPRSFSATIALVLLASCSATPSAGSDDAADAATDVRSPSDPDVPDAGSPGDDDGGSADAAGDGATLPPDPCAAQTPVCPTKATTAGSGLVTIDRCAFPIKEAATWTSLPPLVAALEKIAAPATTAAILADLNRNATPVAPAAVPGGPSGVALAVRWEKEDEDSEAWVPQGLTGSADASPTGLVDGRRVVVVSWYYTPPAGSTYEKGVRLAFVDVTNPQAPTYRFALLVEPKGTVAAPTFAPVTIHAGGLAWVGNLLYVADTGRGFRVFDIAHAMRVATDVDEIGCAAGTCRAGLYKYVIPQVGGFTEASACAPLFSWVSLDRSTTPPSLLSGEYCGGTACASKPLAGRVYRWPLDGASGRLRAGTSWPSEVMLMGQQQVQGGASRNGLYYLSSSAPAGGGGALYRVKPGKSATSTWLDAPEDLMVDEKNGLLWSLSEGAGARVVAGMRVGSYPAP